MTGSNNLLSKYMLPITFADTLLVRPSYIYLFKTIHPSIDLHHRLPLKIFKCREDRI